MGNSHQHMKDDLATYLGDKASLALLLDFDGTLSPIVSHPSLATLPPDTKTVLESLSRRPDVFVAIVSGRSIQDVKEKVGMDGITYAGSHGTEIVHHDGVRYMSDADSEKLQQQKDKAKDLASKLMKECGRKGAWVENKGALLTFHFREVPEKDRQDIKKRARELMTEAGFNVGSAHCALESKPQDSWDKGRAVTYILSREFGEDWADKAKVIYIGDDVTDEDAMKDLKGKAVTFHVIGNNNIDTVADKKLANTDDVVSLLKLIEEHMKKRGLVDTSTTGIKPTDVVKTFTA